MISITFLDRDFSSLRSHLLRGSHADEEGAFLICGVNEAPDRLNLLVRELIPIPGRAFIEKGPAGLTVHPDFVAPLVKKCRMSKASLVLAHSHPFSDRTVAFSGIDDAGEYKLFPKIRARAPHTHLGAMVFGQRSVAARLWIEGREPAARVDEIRTVGSPIRRIILGASAKTSRDQRFDRQVLVFTQEGHQQIRAATAGLIGAGGIGSLVFQQLVHLGVKKIIFADPDLIERSNLSRTVGTVRADAQNGTHKVTALARYGASIGSDTELVPIVGDVYHKSVAMRLRDADVLFCCTDTMTSRMVATRLCSQYLIPLIDTGINIQASGGKISRIAGRIMRLLPEDPCLDCLEFIDREILQLELMSPAEREQNSYVQGIEGSPEPSVISFNGTVAALAVSEFLNVLTGFLSAEEERTYLMYDGIQRLIRKIRLQAPKSCGVCDEVRGMGDLLDLPCLLDK